MKNLQYISPLPLLLFITALFLPFVEHTTTWNSVTITQEYGYEINMIYLPLGIMIGVLFVVNIWRTRFVAIVTFVFCFGILFSLFLAQFEMKPESSFTTHTFRIGYFLALFSVPLLMVILMTNLVKIFKSPKK